MASVLRSYGYLLDGFSPAAVFLVGGKRVLVSSSARQNLCAFVQHRSFRVMPLDLARRQYPFIFVVT